MMGALHAAAELQNVTVGGEVRIRGSYWRGSFNSRTQPDRVGPQLRVPAYFLQRRAIGDVVGGQNVISYYDWDSRESDYHLIEQRTAVRVQADFTNQVSAFIELDSFEVWGEDFRSDHVTGRDTRAATADDVEVYQAYIQVDDMFGIPLRARVGRQEIVLGDGWLVGNDLALPEFSGLTFDAIRLDYETDALRLTAFWAKLAEAGIVEEDGDTDLMGLYAAYQGLENISVEAYWLWLRDSASLNDTNYLWFVERLESWFGLDDYDVTNLHTVGLRAAGAVGALDYDVQGAYQFGEADRIGFLFRPFDYGDDGATFDAWAMDVELGYTFDVAWQPRVYVGGAYFGGEDNRHVSFLEWVNSFDRPQASVSFNRLFSNKTYSLLFDEIGQMSNVWTVRAGVTASPAESIETGLEVAYFETLEPFDMPAFATLAGLRVPVAPALSFWTTACDAELGWEVSLWATYHYSEDLLFKAGWSHLFTGPGLEDGNYSDANGLGFNGGTDGDDADYFFIETVLSF
jgi:Alginate export